MSKLTTNVSDSRVRDSIDDRDDHNRPRKIMPLMVSAALAAGIALGVVGVAFQNAPSAPPAAAAKTIGSAVAAGNSASNSRHELLRTLGILRTSPTPTDLAVIACIKRTANRAGGFRCLREIPEVIQIIEHPAAVAGSFLASLRYPKLDLALIRTVRLGRSGDTVRFFPLNWQSSSRSAQRTWGIVASFVFGRGGAETDVLPTSVRTLRVRGVALFPGFLYVGRPKRLTAHEGAIIVPDGVAKITVDKASLGGGRSVVENVTAAVHDNLATVALKMPTFGSGFGFGTGSLLQVTWYDPHGRVIRHTTNPLSTYGQVSPK